MIVQVRIVMGIDTDKLPEDFQEKAIESFNESTPEELADDFELDLRDSGFKADYGWFIDEIVVEKQ